MWGNGGGFNANDGGFVSSQGDGGFSSPAGQGDRGTRGKRSQNIVPVTIKQLLDCEEDNFRIMGIEAHVVNIVGLVKSVETTTTKISCHIDDQTGVIEVVHYVGTDGDAASNTPTLPIEGTYGRVVGALRNLKGTKYVVIYKYFPVPDMNELTCHLLEVVQVPLKLRKLKEAEALKTGVGMQNNGMSNTLSNSMIASNFGGVGTGLGSGQPISNVKTGFGSSQNLVLSIIQGCTHESGIHRDEIVRNLQNKLNAKEITQIIEDLSGEGHIYSTVDDDHYRVTD